MDTKKFKFWNRIVALAVFLISAMTYLLTIEPTASFWDCGEFIASSYKLEVGHPPGNPVFQLFARFATMFTGPEHAALAVNAMNAILSALTILLLYLTTVFLAKRLFKTESDGTYSLARSIVIMGSGAVGALAYTFSDTFWFSAVEGEVYAMSSLFTALVFWAMTKWYEQADEPYANRWLALIAFLMGLSIGVHLLNLLTIPALVFMFYYRKRENLEYSFMQLIGIFLVSVVLLAVILYGIIPNLPLMAAWFDRFFVNTMGLPFNSGAAFFMLLLLGLCFYGMYVTLKKKKALLNTILLCFTMIVIGFSMFAIVIIRSSVKTPTNEYQPDNPYTLIRYLGREQYGSNPLIYGQAFDSPVYTKRDTYWAPVTKTTSSGETVHEYIEAQTPMDVEYYPEGKMLFPRMWSSMGIDPVNPINHPDMGYYRRDVSPKDGYSHDFVNAGNDNINPQPKSHVDFYFQYMQDPQWVSYKDEYGRKSWFVMPSFTDNLRFFSEFQMNWMYWRYFMWNFAGRQNDFHGDEPNPLFGNWESGIGFIDEPRLGDQSGAPDFLKNNKGKNHYYMLPLLLGLFGIFFQYARDKRGSWLTFLMFFMTGIAIVIYLNQPPYQVRERDYAYAGSFYSFSIWIGLGVAALYALIIKLFEVLGESRSQVKRDVAVASAVTCLTMGVPVLMAVENWDDHDRSNRYTVKEIAWNYLNSVGPDGILITHGDNDTFPLWYAQEVEGIRTDVRVVNTSLLGMDWHIDQMKWAVNESAPLDLTLDQMKYLYGTNDYMYVHGVVPRTAASVIDHIKNDDNVLYMVSYRIPDLDENPEWNPGYGNNSVKEDRAYVGSKKGVYDIRADLLKDEEFSISQDPEYMSKKEFIEDLLGRPLEVKDIEIISMSELGPYVPTRKIIVPVNKENILKYGILDERYSDRIPEKITLSMHVDKIRITKAELFMLDLLSNYQWDRPINMLGMGGEINIGLKEYLMYEGFSYKFVPIRNWTSSSDVGFSDPEDLYYKMKNVYKWDALKRTDYFVDYQNLYTFCGVLPQRQIFVNVAKELLEVGECEKALEMLDMCMECVPVENYPLDMSYLGFNNEYWVSELATLYIALGERDKGMALLDSLSNQLLASKAYLREFDSVQSVYDKLLRDMQRLIIVCQYDVDILLKMESDPVSSLVQFVYCFCDWLPVKDMDNVAGLIYQYSDECSKYGCEVLPDILDNEIDALRTEIENGQDDGGYLQNKLAMKIGQKDLIERVLTLYQSYSEGLSDDRTAEALEMFDTYYACMDLEDWPLDEMWITMFKQSYSLDQADRTECFIGPFADNLAGALSEYLSDLKECREISDALYKQFSRQDEYVDVSVAYKYIENTQNEIASIEGIHDYATMLTDLMHAVDNRAESHVSHLLKPLVGCLDYLTDESQIQESNLAVISAKVEEEFVSLLELYGKQYGIDPYVPDNFEILLESDPKLEQCYTVLRYADNYVSTLRELQETTDQIMYTMADIVYNRYE